MSIKPTYTLPWGGNCCCGPPYYFQGVEVYCCPDAIIPSTLHWTWIGTDSVPASSIPSTFTITFDPDHAAWLSQIFTLPSCVYSGVTYPIKVQFALNCGGTVSGWNATESNSNLNPNAFGRANPGDPDTGELQGLYVPSSVNCSPFYFEARLADSDGTMPIGSFCSSVTGSMDAVIITT